MAQYRIIVREVDVVESYVQFTGDLEREEGGEWVRIVDNRGVKLRYADVAACSSLAEVRDLLIERVRDLAEVRRESLLAAIAARIPELPVTIPIGDV